MLEEARHRCMPRGENALVQSEFPVNAKLPEPARSGSFPCPERQMPQLRARPAPARTAWETACRNR